MPWVSVPLRGVGRFLKGSEDMDDMTVSVPLRGVGRFGQGMTRSTVSRRFPSPCGVWVVSIVCTCGWAGMLGFRPLAGCGLFLSPRIGAANNDVSVPLRGVGCFGKAAHSFWCNRKKNCQLCYFIVSYWQMFINSKLRNCKVPCEAHKTAT